MRDRLIELIRQARKKTKDANSTLEREIIFAEHLLTNGVIVPPCKVGDKFYKIERWCTEGGFWEKPRCAYSGTCEDCCEECDGKDEIIEYTFHSPQQILSLEREFGKYVFLSHEEAEKALKGGAE